MRIVEVKDKKTIDEFLMLPVRLYKNDEHYIQPLNKDIESVFDAKKNKKFRHGEAIRWLLVDDAGKTIGRVAAFIDRKTANKSDQPTGGMGFFECINDQKAAFTLFDKCKAWLEERGMEAMDGPINFGERDRWWGLLVDGFYEPNYCMPYNFGCYKDFFEAYGFQIYFKQYTYYRKVKIGGISEIIREKADRVAQNPKYHFEHSRKKNLHKYTNDFQSIYNEAWGSIPGVAKMSSLQARALMNQLKPIIDEKLLWFAYYEDKPIAFYLMLPEINKVIRHMNGKMDLYGKMLFLYYKWAKKIDKAFGLIFGVVPEHQGKGVEGAIVMAFSEVAWAPGFPYEDFEMNWIGDFNPLMMRVAEQVGGKINKTHHTYRKLFDETKEFKRAPVMGRQKSKK